MAMLVMRFIFWVRTEAETFPWPLLLLHTFFAKTQAGKTDVVNALPAHSSVRGHTQTYTSLFQL